jgi:hypothetical protein
MGNAESGNPVRNMDKRTARREYKDDFAEAIKRYRLKIGYSLEDSHKHLVAAVRVNQTSSLKSIKVYVRKRPIFPHELQNSEFDVVTCFADKIIVHDARMHNDMKRQLMNHHEFQFDQVFHEKANNELVYAGTTRPLVELAIAGGYATALVYGQTGSGKVSSQLSIYQFMVNLIKYS